LIQYFLLNFRAGTLLQEKPLKIAAVKLVLKLRKRTSSLIYQHRISNITSE